MIGTLILIGIGKWIELRYFKNGISLVLFINIIASMPNDVLTIISLKMGNGNLNCSNFNYIICFIDHGVNS